LAEDSSDGKVSFTAQLQLDRTTFHPGESIQLTGILKNAGPERVKLPATDFARQFAFARIHIATPAAREFVYEPHAKHPLRSSLTAVSPRSFSIELAPGAKRKAFQHSFRLSDDLTGWSNDEDAPGRLSLRAPGEYRIWFEYRVPAVANAPEEAWAGSVESRALSFTVSELAAAERLTELPEEQRAALETLQRVAPTSIDGREVLQRAALRAENEPLAERLVELCRQDAYRSSDFISMLSWRACAPDNARGAYVPMPLGIDGPYLKTAALSTLAAFEDASEARLRPFRSSYAVNIAIAYVRFHPEDRDVRHRLEQLAARCAPLPPRETLSAKGRATPPPQATPQIPTVMAWHILLELGVLHAGMSINEATQILGPPSKQSDEFATWYIDTPRHVNPGLSATVQGDRITAFHRYSG
jgi:hypothetical protein